MSRRYLVLAPDGSAFASSNYRDAAERWVRVMGPGYIVCDLMTSWVAS